ncbi:translation initiation factor IF-3 [Aneurinibacillus sp. Ricciae_BoGa-3]|uniref:translation initiation factor IF-3 n=1 Tax=Aneurinibacillus sp. Ricciae_BoGa-3 TaxID=3022697 RepID=UPI00234239F7|nr:translation initiation factor IF-3 [Aneurinibacillus sp. Ricciae_BoGa-3]WCK56607.1 translation initiation factor IF-3 [Aneurinibacillus sp. Ricciae_BoGa-3]
MIINEKIKASVVELTGLYGEDLGILPTNEALRIAKELCVDLVCLSLTSSPPPCQLMDGRTARQKKAKDKQAQHKLKKGPKIKEIQLTAGIETHDFDTKRRQAEKILESGDFVQLTVRLQRKESDAARKVVDHMAAELSHCGKKEKGVHTSGKQVSVVLRPL